MKVGDTVDPRTLPVGAKFRFCSSPANGCVFEVVAPGECLLEGRRETIGAPTLDMPAILLSLPAPIEEPVELGTLAENTWFRFQPDEGFDPNVDRQFIRTTIDGLAMVDTAGSSVRMRVAADHKVHRRPPTSQPAKRPPCDACGEESCNNPVSGAGLYMVDGQPARLCATCWRLPGSGQVSAVRARRAQQTSTGSEASLNSAGYASQPVVSSLPAYDQIAGWLGAEWVMCSSTWEIQAPRVYTHTKWTSPWVYDDFGEDGRYRCYLRHTSGQRVEVTAQSVAKDLRGWELWFDLIRAGDRGKGALAGSHYAHHVRWLDPDTKTFGSETPKCAPSNPQLVDRPLAEPEAKRWTTTDPARIAALEAILAEQVASGGQDCQAARNLVERAADLAVEERLRSKPPVERLSPERQRSLALGGPLYLGLRLQPGPRLMRHELPSDQRLDRKRTGR